MKKIFSLIALLLSFALIMSACGSSAGTKDDNSAAGDTTVSSDTADNTAPSSQPQNSDEGEGSSDNTDSTGTDEEYVADPEYAAVFPMHDPDEIVYRYCGYDVTWRQYFSWIYSFAAQIEMYYGDIDWDAEFTEGYTFGQYGKLYAESRVNQYLTVRYGASTLGYEHNDETRAAAESRMQEDADAYYNGDIEALKASIETMFLNEEYYLEMYEDSELYFVVFNDLFGETGSKLTIAEINEYLENNDYLHAKHILFKTVDDSYQALSDEEKNAQKAKADEVYNQLKVLSGVTLADKFDELMAEYSEDPGYVSYPNGYYFTAGEMVASFENTARELKVGQLSGIIESEYGYHIMYRPEIKADDLFYYDSSYNAYTLSHFVAMEKYAQLQSGWGEGEPVVYTDAFASLNLAELFNAD
ncbi:MAG: peptidylprolyl isomerase [Oscillospiraceae bacterium]|nr:peptidylprolyl isomerase [Oscillospiraceae bacterium]